jgi:hypothetical protein
MGLFVSVKHSKHDHSTDDKNKDDDGKDHHNHDGSHHHGHADGSNGKLVKKQGLNSASAVAIREKDASAAVGKLVMSMSHTPNCTAITNDNDNDNDNGNEDSSSSTTKSSSSSGEAASLDGTCFRHFIIGMQSMGLCCGTVAMKECLEELFLFAADFVDTNCSAAALRRKAACFGGTVTSGQDPTNEPEAEMYAEHSYAHSNHNLTARSKQPIRRVRFVEHHHHGHENGTDKNKKDDKQQQQQHNEPTHLTHGRKLIVKREGLRRGGARTKSGVEKKSPNEEDDANTLLIKKQGVRGAGIDTPTPATSSRHSRPASKMVK